MRATRRLAFAAAFSFLLPAGCYSPSRTHAGATMGAGLGGLAGGIIGHQSGHTGAGALLGAATGAVAGGLIGNAEDARAERDVAVAHASQLERSRLMLTNHDLIRMAQSGVGEEVIITSVQTRGGRFDLSPDAIIQLKASGVSDRVILAVQRGAAPAPPPIVDPPHVLIVPPPGPPGLEVGVVVGPGPHYHRPSGRWHRRHPL